MDKLSRRDFLRMSALAAAGTVAVACAKAEPTTPPTATPVPPTPTSVAIKVEEATSTPVPTVAPSKYKEAPMLADMVAAGSLPPADERLPPDPQVVVPVERVGDYGGTWYAVTPWASMSNIEMALYDPPIRWKPDYTGYEVGLLEDFGWEDDGKTVVWSFRKGLKWSDGEPFVPVDDLGFWLI